MSNTEPIRVLLVDSEWVAESLAVQGFAVCTATNGMDALKCLASVPVDVLFTDINLAGGMDGTVLARRARELLPDLPVVYASGRVNILDPQVRVPGSTFVPKPYVPSLIGRVLANAVESAAARVPA
ncbi:MAG: response regulator [Xanthobacteraceae bacterium]